MRRDVFVSHSSRDVDLANEVLSLLEKEGLRCWIAPRDVPAGADYGEAIIDAIEETSALVLLMSRASNESRQVQVEVERAFSKGRPVFPVRILPGIELPLDSK